MLKVKKPDQEEGYCWRKQVERGKRALQAERPHGQSLRDEKGSGMFEVRAWGGD